MAEACVAGPQDGLGAVGHLELGEDGRDVVRDRLGAKAQLVGDLAIVAAGGAASGCSEILPAVTPGADPILKGKTPVYQRALPHQGEPSLAGPPDSHPSWRPLAMGV